VHIKSPKRNVVQFLSQPNIEAGKKVKINGKKEFISIFCVSLFTKTENNA
jgi:hypothetical protein